MFVQINKCLQKCCGPIDPTFYPNSYRLDNKYITHIYNYAYKRIKININCRMCIKFHVQKGSHITCHVAIQHLRALPATELARSSCTVNHVLRQSESHLRRASEYG